MEKITILLHEEFSPWYIFKFVFKFVLRYSYKDKFNLFSLISNSKTYCATENIEKEKNKLLETTCNWGNKVKG